MSLWLFVLVILLTALLVSFYVRYFPVITLQGWIARTWVDNVPRVSALALHPDDGLYATQEFYPPRGTLLHIQKNGERQLLLGNLGKPDGLVAFGDGIAVGQESGIAPVLWYRQGKVEELFTGNAVEALAAWENRYLYTVEDRKGGRLLRYDHTTKRLDVLYADGEGMEGITLCPDGTLYFSEKKQGKVYRFNEINPPEPVIEGLKKPNYLLCTPEGLWITEDATAHARVLLFAGGEISVIASHLRSAQTIIEAGERRMLVAEQGRNRILELIREE
ncbi:YncE family protein [Kistimonas scapharcae]|uniref:YncE family protein n=1 Tax=Kistimonas scapharcae TaxID=1036133 RepID=A0ABP8V7F1_9GAMM